MSRHEALSRMTESALRIGREFKLSHVELIDVLAKLTAAMTEAAVGAVESAEKAPAEPMTPTMAAKASTLGVSKGTPDEGKTPYYYYFRARDRIYFSSLGPNIVPVTRVGDIPFCMWTPAVPEDEVAVLIAETKPHGLDAWEAARKSVLGISSYDEGSSNPVYWVERASRYVFQVGPDWFIKSAQPEHCSGFGWKPVENSEIAATILEKARTP